jgi:hypothetical protein
MSGKLEGSLSANWSIGCSMCRPTLSICSQVPKRFLFDGTWSRSERDYRYPSRSVRLGMGAVTAEAQRLVPDGGGRVITAARQSLLIESSR